MSGSSEYSIHGYASTCSTRVTSISVWMTGLQSCALGKGFTPIISLDVISFSICSSLRISYSSVGEVAL